MDKSIKEIIDFRKLIIYITILSCIFGYGFWKGQGNKPVKLNLRYGQEYTWRLNGEYLHLNKNGTLTVENKKGRIIKKLSVKDVPELNKKLSPYGLQLRPIAVGGITVGESGKVVGEVGAGVSIFRAWKAELDAFLTNRGIYLGTSYNVTENFGTGVGVGKGWRSLDDPKEIRAIIYGKWKF